MWGVNSSTNKPKVIGKINGKSVKMNDFMESMNGIKAELVLVYSNNYKMINQFWKNQAFVNAKAWERLILLNAAKKQKIKISDKEVMAFIIQHPLFIKNGQFNMKTYDFIIHNNFSFSPHEFEELMRDNLMVEALRKQILSGFTLSDDEVYQYYKKMNDKFAFSYILVSPDSFVDQISIPEDTVEKFYLATKDNYFDSEKIEIEYIEFPFASLSEKSQAERVAKEFLANLNPISDKLSVLGKTQNLNYKNPEPFSQNDPLPGMKFSKNLQENIFLLKEGEVSEPIVPYEEKGTVYIVRKIKNIPKQMKTFEDIKGPILDALIEQQSFTLAAKQANDIYSNINNNSTSFEDAAITINTELQKTLPITINDYIENIGPATEIVTLASGTAKGIVLPPIKTKKGVLVIRIDEIQPASNKAFEEQKLNLRKFLSFQKEQQITDKWIKENSKDTELFVALDQR